jgi:alpha-ribazole phosphatase
LKSARQTPEDGRLILIRHTAVSGVEGLCYGRSEVALSQTFETDAASVAAALPPGPCVVYSSPSRRCRRLAERFSVPLAIDDRLRELDFGAWEGRAWNDLPRGDLDLWCADHVCRRPPGGESFAELAARALSFAENVVACHGNRCVLAVTHAGVIRALVARARGIPLAEAFSMDVAFGSLHTVTATDLVRALEATA